MKAAITPSYGPAHVLQIRELPKPTLGPQQVLVQVCAAPVTAGDRRLRAADFPGISALPGRLLMGVLKPRNAVQGTMFAGRIVAVGEAVTRFAVGDDVFGSTDFGSYAQYLAVDADGPVALMPAGVSYEEAAAVPYGATTALHFLRAIAKVQPGDKVLIVGASGGVGRFAVQLAKHLGAEVTGVCSRRSFELVRSLGADHVIDYRSEDFTQHGHRYDVIFDIAGKSSFGHSKPALTQSGRYLTLLVSVSVLVSMLLTSLSGGPRAHFDVALGSRQEMEELRALLEQGVIKPVIAERYALDRIAEAHARADSGEAQGCVLVTMQPAPPTLKIAA